MPALRGPADGQARLDGPARPGAARPRRAGGKRDRQRRAAVLPRLRRKGHALHRRDRDQCRPLLAPRRHRPDRSGPVSGPGPCPRHRRAAGGETVDVARPPRCHPPDQPRDHHQSVGRAEPGPRRRQKRAAAGQRRREPDSQPSPRVGAQRTGDRLARAQQPAEGAGLGIRTRNQFRRRRPHRRRLAAAASMRDRLAPHRRLRPACAHRLGADQPASF